jgi:esterase/lipase
MTEEPTSPDLPGAADGVHTDPAVTPPDSATRTAITDAAAAGASDAGGAGGRRRPLWKTVILVIGLVVVGVIGIAVIVALTPISTGGLTSDPYPAADYDEAVARFEELAGQESAVFAPCESLLLTHGEPTDVAVALVHGLTNCPRQFVELGQELYDAGANVLIMRMPYHGLASEDGDAIGDVGNVGAVRAEDFRDYADEVVDIAQGLGDDVRVLGLSAGGVVTAWIGQNREDVERAVVVSPAITLPRGMPDMLDYAFRNFFGRLPNVSLPSGGTLDHAYAGESTRALAEMYILAKATMDQAADTAPAAGTIAVVTNGNDDQVDNGDIRRKLVEPWQAAGEEVVTFEFPADMGLRHDLIDVAQPDEQTDRVYPRLMELLGF